ncbi:LysR family transcriptional regulator [Microbacterium paludicola]|jgi:DNA-binding transcriptional LysR family regulator|uniref:LysR family transcriptional regulator n=1 Tax=Microbacterium paludicola TaxID=300019 RepID=UPI0038791D4E
MDVDFSLTQLRAFAAAASAGSFTAAAQQLRISQPAASELVRRIETAYGLPLFVRAGRRLRLTPAGEELLVWTRSILGAADGADQALRELRGLERGRASFGVLKNASYYLLSDLAERFHREHPGVQVRLVGQNSAEVADAVRSGELEAGLAVLPVPLDGIDAAPLLEDEVVWVSADPARTAAPVTMADIVRAPLVLYDAHYAWRDPTRRQLAERAAREGVELEVAIEVENVEAALELVSRGVGDTMVSRAVANSAAMPAGLSTVGFAPRMYDTIALLTRSDTVLSPGTRRLVDMATEMLFHRRP